MSRSEGRNATIDTLRLVAAVLVIFIHSGIHSLPGITGSFGLALLVIARLAVPFFFMASGYFLYAKSYKDQIGKAKKSIVKLINIFLLASILYFVFYGWYFGSYAFTFDLLTPTGIMNMVLFNYPVYNGALWFLLALISALVIHWVNARYIKRDGLILTLSIIFYVAGLIVSSNYNQFIGSPNIDVMYYRNVLGDALLFTTLGYMAAKYQKQILKYPNSKLFKYSLVTLFLYIVEFYAIHQHVAVAADVYFMLPLVIACVFAWCIKFPDLFKNTIIPAMGSYLALYIYIVHIMVLYTLGMWMRDLGFDTADPKVALVRLLLAIFICIAISALYFLLRKKSTGFIKRFKVVYNRDHNA